MNLLRHLRGHCINWECTQFIHGGLDNLPLLFFGGSGAARPTPGVKSRDSSRVLFTVVKLVPF